MLRLLLLHSQSLSLYLSHTHTHPCTNTHIVTKNWFTWHSKASNSTILREEVTISTRTLQWKCAESRTDLML